MSIATSIFLATLSIAAPKAAPSHAETEIARQLGAILPPNLAVTRVKIRGRSRFPSSATIRVHFRRLPRAGASTVGVNVEHRGKVRRLWAVVELAERVDVVVAVRPLRSGAIIRKTDLRSEKRPKPRGAYVESSIKSLVGQRVLKSVAFQAVLMKGDIELPPLVPRSSKVKVMVAHAGARITTDGRLMKAIRPGERGPVYLDGSRRALVGRLIDRNHFVVEASN